MFNTICDTARLGKRQGKLQNIFNTFHNLFTVQCDRLSRIPLESISNIFSNEIHWTLLYDELPHFHYFVNILNE